jgi:hypothetical protein
LVNELTITTFSTFFCECCRIDDVNENLGERRKRLGRKE